MKLVTHLVMITPGSVETEYSSPCENEKSSEKVPWLTRYMRAKNLHHPKGTSLLNMDPIEDLNQWNI